MSDASLPHAIEDEAHLEELLARPSAADVAFARTLSDDVLVLAGRKFGSADRPDLTWAHNTIVPVYVARRFAGARIVVFSTGNVLPMVPAASSGATEADDPDPVGEYAQSCLGRERVFEHF